MKKIFLDRSSVFGNKMVERVEDFENQLADIEYSEFWGLLEEYKEKKQEDDVKVNIPLLRVGDNWRKYLLGQLLLPWEVKSFRLNQYDPSPFVENLYQDAMSLYYEIPESIWFMDYVIGRSNLNVEHELTDRFFTVFDPQPPTTFYRIVWILKKYFAPQTQDKIPFPNDYEDKVIIHEFFDNLVEEMKKFERRPHRFVLKRIFTTYLF